MATHQQSPNPKAAALLVMNVQTHISSIVNVQNHFSSIARPILPTLAATIRLCRDADIPIIYTSPRHHSPNDYSMLGEWWGDDLILDGTPASKLMPEAGCWPYRVVEKSTYNAF